MFYCFVYCVNIYFFDMYGPPFWRKPELGDAESGADIKKREQY